MTVESVIKLLPESNDQILKFTNELEAYLDSGDINPLDVLVCIKGFEKVIKNVKEQLNELAVLECEKYSEKDIEYKSVKLQVVQTGVKYDFSNCNDFRLNSFKTKESELKNNIKARETFIKGIKGSLLYTDEETGEVYEINEPVKTSTTTAKLTFK